MTNEQQSEQLLKHNSEIAALFEMAKSAHKRIDESDRVTNGIHEIAASVKAMAVQMAAQTESITRIESGQKLQGERIGALEKEPAGKWKTLVSQVVSIIVAGLVGGAFANFIN